MRSTFRLSERCIVRPALFRRFAHKERTAEARHHFRKRPICVVSKNLLECKPGARTAICNLKHCQRLGRNAHRSSDSVELAFADSPNTAGCRSATLTDTTSLSRLVVLAGVQAWRSWPQSVISGIDETMDRTHGRRSTCHRALVHEMR